MESIYEPERFKASEVVNLREHFSEYSNLITDDIAFSSSNEITIESVMGLDSNRLKSLEESCSIDHLICEGELKSKPKDSPTNYTLRKVVSESLPFTRKYSNLEVLRTKASIEEYRSCEKLLLMNKENFHHCVIDKEKETDSPTDLVPGSNFVMNVIFYKPFKYVFNSRNATGRCRFNHEIQVLGKNTLTQLRDKIMCTSDCGLAAEVDGPTADVSHLMKAKEEYPSGCFFVNGVFYNDMRSPKAIEYSKEILEWGIARDVRNLTKADMHTTKLMDLSLRFGYPYVYLHQGDCEHIMVFADAHILTKNDCLTSEKYPRVYALNKSVSTICYMCNVVAAKWLVKDYNRLPQSNTFLCGKCAECYCSKDGEKVGEYKMFPLFITS